MSPEETTPAPRTGVPLGRSLLGGILMGLANLVPGVSGGTMILVVGLYDRFIGAIADLTRLRLSRDLIVFLAVFGFGAAVAVLTMSGLAVHLVSTHRWVMYSLFIGMTLGAAPLLWKSARMSAPGSIAAFAAGLALMLAVVWYRDAQGIALADTIPILVGVGALAATSMILPGISGSYVLLILGMYDTVIGSLSAGALREDLAGSVRIVGAVGVGVALGIGLLSNLLKAMLVRYAQPVHAALLGLVLGSVVGIWPFQDSVDPDMANKSLRKATAMSLAGAESADVLAKYGAKVEGLDAARLAALTSLHAGKSAADLKREGEALETFTPTIVQVLLSLLAIAAGFFGTGRLGGEG